MTALTDSFIFGLANSLHCAGMCGPLAACFLSSRTSAGIYHLVRSAAYVVVGITVGALGSTLGLGSESLGLHSSTLSFVLALTLVVFALGLHTRLAIPGTLGRGGFSTLVHSATRWTRNLGPHGRAAMLGAVTPLLPCGLLWVIYATAFASGSFEAGGQVMLGFALGTLPVLLLAQLHLGWLHRKLGPSGRLWLFRSLMLGAAAILVWRGCMQLSGSSCCGG